MKSRLAPTVPNVVGIGASAGGLAALERFFDALPERPGMAFVVVQHLSPDFKSLMDELLARHTSLPIHLVEDGVAVEENHVYLIPPKMEMIISSGRLLLSERSPQSELNLPIDTFFRSLARDCGHRATAIVMSGGGTDGSRGIRDVRDAGGLVLVQDTGTAQFDGMPKTAQEAGVAHWVLAPQDMPHVLLEHLAQNEPTRRARAEAKRSSSNASGFEAAYQMLEEEFGIDFTHYKPSTITRRIERRLSLAQSPNIDEYVERLRHDHDELDTLYRDLLIGVTHFFRDEDVFQRLEERVLPELLERTPRDEAVRLWVAGCATGEEAYSLAITLQDVMRKVGERPVKIFATDVHRGSLERAGRAIYEADAISRVSPERLERYFLRFGDAYQVVPDIRKMIVFAQHNVMRDAPFTRVDLVTCRNLLIYLQPAAQNKALALFHFALKRGGRLLLGPSETVGALAPEFEVIDKHWRLYEKKTDIRLAFDTRLRSAAPGELRLPATGVPPTQPLTQLVGTYDAILETFMPPSLLVNDRGELVHSFGGASRFLRLRDGRQGLNVVDMVDPGLKMLLVGGLKRALQEANPLVFKNVRFDAAGEAQPFDVTLRRVRSRSNGIPHVLIAIEESRVTERPPTAAATEVHLDQVSREQLTGLEAELMHTRENLQSAIEELETSNEELQAANEEMQASNEELQSTNEELQSVNEELYTVNAEYQRKIAELTEVTNDMDNLLASTEIGTVFLDRQLKIRKFTPQIADTFALVPHDVGRPIETFAHKLDHPELVEDLRRVLASSAPIERELNHPDGKTFFLRILPYRAKSTVDGVVLTVIDVTGLKAAENALFRERHLLNSLMGNVEDAIYFKDSDGRFIRANQPMAKRLGLRHPDEASGKAAADLPDPEAGMALHRQDEAVLRTGVTQYQSLEERPGQAGHWDSVTRLPLRDPTGHIVGTGVIFRDVTEQKDAEERIREAVRRRDQFLAMLSHELRNPLSAVVSATRLLKADGAPPLRERSLAVLERQTQQMKHLLDELLEASRVTENKIELRKEVIDLNEVAREALDAMRAQLDARGLEVTTDLATDALPVDGDAARLQQVVVNLLNNAAKYTPMHGHVRIATRRKDGLATIAIKDDGAGIPPELIESVFELFVQSPRTLDRAAGGLGVGLSLVRSLVVMHGGRVSAVSDGEGKGSEFIVTLPIAGAGRIIAPALRADDGPAALEVPADTRIIIVEDNEDSRESLCELLSLSGLHCRTAESGLEALRLFDAERPDALIIDLGLPVMDGFELARTIRARPGGASTLLIALTGYGQPSDRELSKAAGFDAHLVKPVEPDDLLALLTKLLRAPEDLASSA